MSPFDSFDFGATHFKETCFSSYLIRNYKAFIISTDTEIIFHTLFKRRFDSELTFV